jgi:hypothetical protein
LRNSAARSGSLAALPPAAASTIVGWLSRRLWTQEDQQHGRDGLIIALTIVLNIYGTLALVGGAIYSAYIFWRKRVLFNRMIGNILIAVGALAPAMGGSFITIDLPDFLYLTELVGAVLMYIGFLQTTTVPAVEPAPVSSS